MFHDIRVRRILRTGEESGEQYAEHDVLCSCGWLEVCITQMSDAYGEAYKHAVSVDSE